MSTENENEKPNAERLDDATLLYQVPAPPVSDEAAAAIDALANSNIPLELLPPMTAGEMQGLLEAWKNFYGDKPPALEPNDELIYPEPVRINPVMEVSNRAVRVWIYPAPGESLWHFTGYQSPPSMVDREMEYRAKPPVLSDAELHLQQTTRDEINRFLEQPVNTPPNTLTDLETLHALYRLNTIQPNRRVVWVSSPTHSILDQLIEQGDRLELDALENGLRFIQNIYDATTRAPDNATFLYGTEADNSVVCNALQLRYTLGFSIKHIAKRLEELKAKLEPKENKEE